MPTENPKHKHSASSQQQPYDTILKSLVEGHEQEILTEFVPGIEYLETLDIEVLRPPLRGDRVYRVNYRKQQHILHIEFESGPDENMATRLLNYHAYFFHKYARPVISIIIYPFRTSTASSPLSEMSGDKEILRFHFRTFALWQQDAKAYVQEQKQSFYALLPTMQGADAPLLLQAIEEMIKYYKNDETKLAQQLLWLAVLLRRADTVPFEDKEQVLERLDMWNNLLEEDPYIQKIIQRERQKAVEAAKQAKQAAKQAAKQIAEAEARVTETEARAEARAAEAETRVLEEGLQRAVLSIIRNRFPQVVAVAQEKVGRVKKADALNLLLEQVVQAPDEATMRWLLGTLVD